MKAIILAGGGGTRLWPLSREDFPKQFLSFDGGASLLQKTVERLIKAPFIEEVIVSTNTHHLPLVEKQVASHAKIRMFVEPYRRNTAPAIGLVLKYLEAECGAKASDPILVIPSDHLIEPEAIFLHALEEMAEVAREGKIITFGIRPTKPETGYGYIEIGEKFNSLTFKAARFVEKPTLAVAEKYLENPKFYWNSGMFVFSIETFWKELEICSHELRLFFDGSYEETLARFVEMPDISVDYAVMEKSKEIVVYPLSVVWSDVGSWDSVYEALPKDKNQNVKRGQVFDVDTKNCLIIGESRIVSVVGLEDLIVVETKDAVFVGKKGESQKVKELLKELLKKEKKPTS